MSRGGAALTLVFGPDVSERTRRRIDYAFRVFCAVYGYRLAPRSASGADARICYGCWPTSKADLEHPVGYIARDCTLPVSQPTRKPVDQWQLPCFHLAACGEPDWLGEIFEWISTADELAISDTDSAGRIRFEDGLHGRFGIDPMTPYAALAMRGLNQALRPVLGDAWHATASTPWTGSPQCVMAATHDVDFLAVSTGSTLWRLFKNAAIAVAAGDWRLTAAILSAMGRGLFRMALPLNAILAVRSKEEASGIGSTFNILCRQVHRRDANYVLQDERTLTYLRQLQGVGFELGVHGSYTSLHEPGRLVEEYEFLRRFGCEVLGGRQHWLRYRGGALFEELRRAEARYDCTVGYSPRIGFRAGASFPYPPYDFEREQPFPFLELPLVLMDCALYACCRRREAAGEAVRRLLRAVREFGWGGVSLLWHDTVFDGGQYPTWLGDLYWQLKEDGDAWLSCADLIRTVWPRFESVGLLPAWETLREPDLVTTTAEQR
jgi:hypothetical protein